MAFVSDTFTDTAGTALTSHSGETGATWTQHPNYTTSTFEVNSSNRAQVATGGSSYGLVYASGSPANAEYDVSADIVRENSSDGVLGIVGRFDATASTGYRFQIEMWSGDRYPKLYKIVSGSATLLATAASPISTWSTGVSKAWKLELRDAAKKGFVDGAEVVSSVDNAVTAAGRTGLYGNLWRPLGADNFSALDAAAGATVSPNNASHGHSGQNATLTQVHSLSCAAASHSHTADSASLAQAHQVAINAALHAHQADSVSLAAMSGISIASGNHGHLADIVSLTQAHFLSALSGYHVHSADLAVVAAEGAVAPWPRLITPVRSGKSTTIAKADRTITPGKS